MGVEGKGQKGGLENAPRDDLCAHRSEKQQVAMEKKGVAKGEGDTKE